MTPLNPNATQERAAAASAAGAAPAAGGNLSAQIITLSELHAHTDTEARVDAPAPNADNPLHHVKATVTVSVGSAVLTIGELLKARKDEVFRLDSAIHDPVDLMIEGKVVARGQLVAIDDRFAVRITHLPQALKV